jgi:hypothetical protein
LHEIDPAHRQIIGWREWLALPDLGVRVIKAKIDTGARTSALHAHKTERYSLGGAPWVRFWLHPLQRTAQPDLICDAAIADERRVSDSGGHREKRIVIVTRIQAGDRTWPIEMTLTNRDTMLFRMLLGRTAMENRFVVDPFRSFLFGRLSAAKAARMLAQSARDDA